MRAYVVTASVPAEDEDEDFKQYAGSQSDAAAIKRKLFEDYRDSGLKRGSIETSEVEIPTNKAGLISWLNENAV